VIVRNVAVLGAGLMGAGIAQVSYGKAGPGCSKAG